MAGRRRTVRIAARRTGRLKRRLFTAVLAASALSLWLTAGVAALLIEDVLYAVRPALPMESESVFERRGDRIVTAHRLMARQSFAAEKAPRTFRVFVLGSSQAMGTPFVNQSLSAWYSGEGGMSTWLEDYFRFAFPDRTVEVVNAAVGIRGLRDHLSVYRRVLQVGSPDLVVVLAGNNERDERRVDLSFPQVPSEELDREVARLTALFRGRLKALAARAERSGVKTLLLTVPSNLRDWEPLGAPVFDAEPVRALMRAGRHREAIARLTPFVRERDALALYLKAKCLDAMGDYRSARDHYIQAKDRSRLLLNCRSAWNDEIRAVRGTHVRVLDLERIFFSHAEDGIPGKDLFFDYCHMKLRGSKLAAYEAAKFYLQDIGAPAEKIARLKGAPLRTVDAGALKVLYGLNILRWARMRLPGVAPDLRHNIDGMIAVYRDSARGI